MCMHGPPTHIHSPIHPPTPPIHPDLGISNHSNGIIIELIEIIWFCLQIYDLWRLPHMWMDIWVSVWVDGWSHVIWFCLQIYDLWRHLHAYTTSCIKSLAIEIMSLIIVQMFDFLTIDILYITGNSGHSFDILIFDFLLKPPEPSTAMFSVFNFSIFLFIPPVNIGISDNPCFSSCLVGFPSSPLSHLPSLCLHLSLVFILSLHCFEESPIQQLQMLQSSQFVLSDLWEFLLHNIYRHSCITNTLTHQVRDISTASCNLLWVHLAFLLSFQLLDFLLDFQHLHLLQYCFKDCREQIFFKGGFCSFCFKIPNQTNLIKTILAKV